MNLIFDNAYIIYNKKKTTATNKHTLKMNVTPVVNRFSSYTI